MDIPLTRKFRQLQHLWPFLAHFLLSASFWEVLLAAPLLLVFSLGPLAEVLHVLMVTHTSPEIAVIAAVKHTYKLARLMLRCPFWSDIMTKCEIMAMMMRNENRFHGDPFPVAAKLAACLEKLADQLPDEELARPIQIGGAIYQFGIDKYKQPVDLEDLFPSYENWLTPNPVREAYRRRNH